MVETLTEGLALTTPTGRVTAALLAVFAEFEQEGLCVSEFALDCAQACKKADA